MTLEPKIDRETAEADVNRWLDLKMIPKTDRESNAKSFNNIVKGVMHDQLSIDATGIITHKLNFPILDKDGGVACAEFKYKPRLTVSEIEACLGAGSDTKIYGTALSVKAIPSAYFSKIDTTDLSMLSSIVVFFTC